MHKQQHPQPLPLVVVGARLVQYEFLTVATHASFTDVPCAGLRHMYRTNRHPFVRRQEGQRVLSRLSRLYDSNLLLYLVEFAANTVISATSHYTNPTIIFIAFPSPLALRVPARCAA